MWEKRLPDHYCCVFVSHYGERYLLDIKEVGWSFSWSLPWRDGYWRPWSWGDWEYTLTVNGGDDSYQIKDRIPIDIELGGNMVTITLALPTNVKHSIFGNTVIEGGWFTIEGPKEDAEYRHLTTPVQPSSDDYQKNQQWDRRGAVDGSKHLSDMDDKNIGEYWDAMVATGQIPASYRPTKGSLAWITPLTFDDAQGNEVNADWGTEDVTIIPERSLCCLDFDDTDRDSWIEPWWSLSERPRSFKYVRNHNDDDLFSSDFSNKELIKLHQRKLTLQEEFRKPDVPRQEDTMQDSAGSSSSMPRCHYSGCDKPVVGRCNNSICKRYICNKHSTSRGWKHTCSSCEAASHGGA